MRKLTVAMAVMCASIGAPAAAEAWRVASQGDTAVMLVDTDSLRRNGSIVLVTVMTVSTPQRVGDWDRSVILREINCAANSSSMLDRRFYLGSTQIGQSNNREQHVVHGPGSMMGGVVRAACGSGDYVTDVVADPVAAAWSLINATSGRSGSVK